jgi:DNA-binding transcriptional MerR regulator
MYPLVTTIHLTLELAPRSIFGMRRMEHRDRTIGVLARTCGVSPDTVRFYEREGLLPKARRTSSRYRIYAEADETRLQFIRRAQAIGLTLDDIRGLLRQHHARTPDECRRVAALLRERIEGLDRKLAELKAFRKVLAENLARCEAAHSEPCPVVVDLSRSHPRDASR